ncbi:MAG: hypothetical protein KDA21_06220 [Phycisphaerales bacterium]|nr:hypothetical protein [Phycisphaerales bacterium]
MRLRLYDSMVRAQQAAQFLMDAGILVRVFPLEHGVFVRPRFELVLATRRLHARAEEILAEFEQEGLVPEGDWEAQSQPDLTLLDPKRCAVACASCGMCLPHDIDQHVCPGCGTDYDLVERILETHGPDVLLDAFEEGEVAGTQFIDLLDWQCERCDYGLGGLPRRGRCPECGNLYDKEDMFRRHFK